MSNPYYNPTGNPTTGGSGASATIRAEFAAIAAGFALMPGLPLTANAALIVNAAGTGFSTTTGGLLLAGNFATTGAFNTTLVQGASVSLTLPLVNGTLATLAGTETLTNKTFVAPILGTPASGVATNLTGTAAGLTAGNVTTNANLTGGVTSAGNVATVVTNANLTGPITSVGNATSIASQTGTGTKFVVDTSPTLVTPNIGVATATSLNGNTFTTGTYTLTGAGGKTLTFSNTLTLTGTDASSVAFGAGGTVLYSGGALGTPTSGTLTSATGLPISTGVSGLGTGVATFLGTPSSANLASAMTDETGSGALVFANSPTLVTAVLGSSTATTQAAGDNSTKLATTAYVDRGAYAYVTVAAGVATVAKQFGFTSVVRTGAGTFTCTLSAAMPDLNYRVLVTSRANVGGTDGAFAYEDLSPGNRSTTVFYLATQHDNTGAQDPGALNIQVFA